MKTQLPPPESMLRREQEEEEDANHSGTNVAHICNLSTEKRQVGLQHSLDS